ncbi:hypothetical protein Rsw2DRAFT_3346 [Rhodobacter ferrooxidans]|uniref:Uncharacterized protein n=1 Tax=Rhodobacter ferrooxidans TaxID=371731 RepID=C8S5L7_9RHOB|nr:hypothetical protein Rsw2DRAFT_3346 [Rhodobacter sp. SW2]
MSSPFPNVGFRLLAPATADLVGQAEHGYNSPVWLVTSDRGLAARVTALVPELIVALPEPNRASAAAAWADLAEVILCEDAEEMARVFDVTVGDWVSEGDRLAVVLPVAGTEPHEIVSPFDGLVMTRRDRRFTRRGENVIKVLRQGSHPNRS